jgi:hypothetical protein
MGPGWSGRVQKWGKGVNDKLGLTDDAELAIKSLHAISGARAFSKYSQLLNRLTAGSPGVKGIVVSEKWQTIFHWTGRTLNENGKLVQETAMPAAELIEHGLLFVSFLASVMEQAPKIESILRSSDPDLTKAAKLTGVASTGLQRALWGCVTSGADLIYKSLSGWSMVGGLIMGMSPVEVANSPSVQVLNRSKMYVHQGFDFITDSDTQLLIVRFVVTAKYSQVAMPLRSSKDFVTGLAREYLTRPRR